MDRVSRRRGSGDPPAEWLGEAIASDGDGEDIAFEWSVILAVLAVGAVLSGVGLGGRGRAADRRIGRRE